VRREATMIAASNFVGLPLMFLSSILITERVMPHWMQELARFNPVNWGVRAARDAVVYGGNWRGVGIDLLRRRERRDGRLRHLDLPLVSANALAVSRRLAPRRPGRR
jgi:hypothetical protein